jgi:Domain of unknown function (DUF3819)
VNDNLDLGCTIIERAATDKAVRDIDKSLAAAYDARASARARGVDFHSRATLQLRAAGPFPAALPDGLKPKPANAAQQRVYEDFARLPRGAHPLPRPFGDSGAGAAPPGSPLQVRVLLQHAALCGAPGLYGLKQAEGCGAHRCSRCSVCCCCASDQCVPSC